jgi:hypothetical protein
MTLPMPTLDHVVINAREGLDEALARYQHLGFVLTPRGYHTLGSMNHLAMFATDYLELLGFGDGTSRPELAPFPVGLNGLVFKTEDADAVYAHAQGAGLPILPVQAFSRPVELSDGLQDARFRTTRLDPARIAMGRVYFCEHLTPRLVWRPEWQAHPNGAYDINRVLIATAHPRRSASLFITLFGPEAVTERGGKCFLTSDQAPVELATPAAIAAEFGDAAAEPNGRREYLVGLELKAEALAKTKECLRDVPGVRIENSRVVVPATSAFNTTLVFTE